MSDRFISDEQLDAVLAASDPLVAGSLDTPSVARAVADLRTSTLPTGAVQNLARAPTRASRSRTWSRPVILGVSVAAVAVVVSLVGLGAPGSHTAGSGWLPAVTPAQAAQLDRVAAATTEAADPQNGRWLYQRYETFVEGGLPWQTAFINFHITTATQHWTRDQIQRWRTETVQFVFDSPRDQATYRKYESHFRPEIEDEGGTKTGHVSDVAMFRPSTATSPLYPPQEFPQTRLGILNRFKQLVAVHDRSLPKRFRSQLRANLASGLFGVLVGILEQSPSQRQRAAAFQALAYVRGVKLLGQRKDSEGRTGLAISLSDSRNEAAETLIVDRSNGNLLQDTLRQWTANGHTTLTRTVYLSRAIVRSMTATPDGPTVPYRGPKPKRMTGPASR